MTTMEITTLSETSERLVVFGGATAPSELQGWLVSCGIARHAPGQTQWMVPTLPYLRSVLPAKDRQDLIRKTVIRDPQYRLHIDLSLARVLQIIAKSERWTRFEELAFGILGPTSQRLLSLVEWVAAHCGQTANGLRETHWNQFESDFCPGESSCFQSWDNHLWGHARDSADLFPLLEDLYLPLVDQPVHFELSGRQAQVMATLIEAARADDGVLISGDDAKVCDELKHIGAPILCRHGSQLCTLTGHVELSVTVTPTTLNASMQSAPLGVPLLAKRSNIHSVADETSWLKSAGPGLWTSQGTFLSTNPVAATWPSDPVLEAPPWALLPDSSTLTESALLKKVAGLEDAVISLDRHPLYGLLLQFLVAEALDRELGDETLLLTPPLDKVGDEAEWNTTVLYRPASKSETGSQSQSIGYLSLGRLDFVLDRIAQHMGLEILPLPYSMTSYGIWSWALHLLIDLKVVVGQRDRWALSTALHDRLYTGNLMAEVLRDRRETRQSIHQVLLRLWKDAANSVAESQAGMEVTA